MPQKPNYDTKLNMGVIPTKSKKENKGLKFSFVREIFADQYGRPGDFMLQYPGDRHSIKTLSAVFFILSFASYLAWYFRHFRLFLTFSQPERISDGKFCKLILTFESVEDFLGWEHSNKTSLTVCSHGTIYSVWSSSFRICRSLFQAPR